MNVVGFVPARAATHGMLLEMNTSDSSSPSSPSTTSGIRLGAALAASLAVVSLAAGCGGSKSSTAASTSANSATTSAAASPTAGASSSSGVVDGGASPSAAGAGSSSLPPKPTTPDPGGPRDCSTDMLKLTIEPLHEPINHVMISAQNISQLPCHLNKYPLLRTFEAQQTPMQVAQATKPAIALVLQPGATAYAGVMTSSADGSGTNGRNVPAMLLQLQASSAAAGGVGRPASVVMPHDAQYVDGSAVVTYWESDIQTATY